MAKYELRILNIFEDNEEAAEDKYQQYYVDAICEDAVDLWQSSQVTLLIDNKRYFKATMDGGPKDPHLAPSRLKDWPWQRADKQLPDYGEPVMLYHGGNEEEDAMYYGCLRHAEDLDKSFDKLSLNHGDGFSAFSSDGLKVIFYQPSFYRLYWRTIERPEIEKETIDNINIREHMTVK